MRVRVRLFGDAAELAGQSELALDLRDGDDLGALLSAMDDQTGRAVSPSFLFDERTILPDVAVLVNGGNVLLGSGLRTRLADGDQVVVMPLLAGG